MTGPDQPYGQPRRNLRMPPFDEFPDEVLRIAGELRAAGFEASVAGGAVRDLLLGRNEPLLQFWHRLWDEAAAP